MTGGLESGGFPPWLYTGRSLHPLKVAIFVLRPQLLKGWGGALSSFLERLMISVYVMLPFVAFQISSWRRSSSRWAEVGVRHLKMEIPLSDEWRRAEPWGPTPGAEAEAYNNKQTYNAAWLRL